MGQLTRRSRRLIFAILGVIAVVFGGAALTVATSGGFEPSGAFPEDVATMYTVAVIDGDIAQAKEYLHPPVEEPCGPVPWNTHATILRWHVGYEPGQTVRVPVSIITVQDSGPFGVAEESVTDTAFELKKVGGQWLITSPPAALTVCAGNGG